MTGTDKNPSQVTDDLPKARPFTALVKWRALVSRLRARREALGMTQQDLADRIAKGLRTIQRWENFEVTPSGSELFLWCSALGWDVTAGAPVAGGTP